MAARVMALRRLMLQVLTVDDWIRETNCSTTVLQTSANTKILEYCHKLWYGKLEWHGYSEGEKYDMFSRFYTIAVCDEQTDRHLATA